MLQHKDIHKVGELKNDFSTNWLKPESIFRMLGCFSFSALCKCLNPLKMRGYSFHRIFSILLAMPFMGSKSVHELTHGIYQQYIEAHKDVFYRLKNSTRIQWRMILWLFAVKYRKIIEEQGGYPDGKPRCLIVDDTTLVKTGRFIEKVSRVWDHVSNTYILGFKLLVMGYWDGTSFIGLDFSLHREKGKNKQKPYGLRKKEYKKQYRKKRKVGNHCWDRAMEADQSKIESALKMFHRAISQGFQVDYFLMDSWFTCLAFIEAVKRVKKQTVHLIGMYKNAKAKFYYAGEQLTYTQIRKTISETKRCRRLGLYYKEARVTYKGHQLKLFFSRQGKRGKWKVFLTTDTTLSFIRMIEIYQIRWSIEVFFKESRQLLKLGRCQSTDFDAQIADTTITMIQHLLLTLHHRFEVYESKGALFAHIEEQMLRTRLDQRLWGLFQELIRVFTNVFDDIDEMELMEKIMTDEKVAVFFTRLLPVPEPHKEAA